MSSLNSVSVRETPLSKEDRLQMLSLPSFTVEVLTCVKRWRFLTERDRSWSSFTVFNAPTVRRSNESKDALNHCSGLTPQVDSVFVIEGDCAPLTVVGLQNTSLCRSEASLLYTFGVSHQLMADDCGTSLESPTLSLGEAISFRFSLGVSLNSAGDVDVKEATPAVLPGLWNKPEYPLSVQSL